MADKPHSYAQMKQETVVRKLPHASPAELKAADNQIGIIHLISGTTRKGEDFYAYVAVKPSLYQEFFQKMANHERVDVEKYGHIMYKAFGKVPSDEVKQEMTEKFGIDHQFVQHLTEAIEKRRKGKK